MSGIHNLDCQATGYYDLEAKLETYFGWNILLSLSQTPTQGLNALKCVRHAAGPRRCKQLGREQKWAIRAQSMAVLNLVTAPGLGV